MSTAMGDPLGARKISSFPSTRHLGRAPPSREICHLPTAGTAPEPGGVKGCTYTSSLPDSSEIYANQRVSGEKLPCASLNVVFTKGTGFRSFPSSGRTMRSYEVFKLFSVYS